MYHDNASGCFPVDAPSNPATSTTTVEQDSTNSRTYSPPNKHLSDRHYQHCCGSDLSQQQRNLDPRWIEANCYSVDSKQAKELLGYRAQSGGIAIEGANGQLQFRPDRPWRTSEDKKKKRNAAKYLTPAGAQYDAFLPFHPDNPDYWLDLEALKQSCWQIGGIPHLIVTEGAFKAICACSKELPTLALLGVEMGLTSSKDDPQGKRYLVPSLETFAQEGFGFILAFDADISNKEGVQQALYKLGYQLQKFNASVYVLPQWDENLGKGIDNFIVSQSIEEFRQLLIRSVTFESWAAERQANGEKLTPLQRAWRVVNQKYADRLRFNELTLTVELDGELAELDQFYLDLELEHNCSIAKDKAYDLAIRCAKQNPYHPIKDYLNHVTNTVIPIDITNLSQRYFGTIDPIYNEMMYGHLIGSVARVFNPGCKKDESVILQGPQGIFKSTFWKILYGEDFFSDSLKGTDRDNLLILHQYWALELAEFETITSKKQAGELKAFICAGTDTFREPYGRYTKARKRQSVIVGSVNPDNFLVDETGNRRYWVIPIQVGRIDIPQLSAERNAIWAAAVAAYRRGESWHLSQEREQELFQLNTDYCHCDSWEVPVSNYLISRSMVTTFEVLTNALDFESAHISKRDEMRVANILRSLGWKKTVATYLGKRQRLWVKGDSPEGPPGGSSGGDPPPEPPTPPATTSPLEVDLPSNPQPASTSTITDPPDPPLSQTSLADGHHQGGDDDLSPNKCLGSEVVLGGSLQQESLNHQTSDPIHLPTPPLIHLSQDPQIDPPHHQTELPDYSTYPHLTSNDIRAQKKRAKRCKELMLACTNKEELARFRQESGFSPREIDWVYRHCLTSWERETIQQAATANQLNLLETISYQWDEVLAAIDAELNRLGWTIEQAQTYLMSTYGVKSHHQLTDEQIINFWEFLEKKRKT